MTDDQNTTSEELADHYDRLIGQVADNHEIGSKICSAGFLAEVFANLPANMPVGLLVSFYGQPIQAINIASVNVVTTPNEIHEAVSEVELNHHSIMFGMELAQLPGIAEDDEDQSTH